MRVIFCVEPHMYVHATHNNICVHYIPICASMKECIYLHVLYNEHLPYVCRMSFYFYILMFAVPMSTGDIPQTPSTSAGDTSPSQHPQSLEFYSEY